MTKVLKKQLGIRTLFKGLDKYTETDGSLHHEYSIRPDTFAFKATNNKSNQSSPFHQLRNSNYNILDYVYRNSINYPFSSKSPRDMFNSYPMINSKKLANHKSRPKRIKMSVADFIDDSLYNPNYGYFSLEVEIYQTETPFDYNNIKNVDDFLDVWQKSYVKYDNMNYQPKRQELIKADSVNYANPSSKFASTSLKLYNEEKTKLNPVIQNKRSLQLWHTPTELFQPFYGESIARNILNTYKANINSGELVIYEMGGGNGTLMVNILKYLQRKHPEIYQNTKYKIIEISSQLAYKQYNNALKEKLVAQGLDSSKFEIINKSIFDWTQVEENPCFFIALEVFDNFSHDLIRYDIATGEPFQGHVLIDDKGDFYEFFTPKLSYYSETFLQLRENGPYKVLESLSWRHKLQSWLPFINCDKIHPLHHSTRKLLWKNSLFPLKDNLSPGEFIPTRLVEFLHILKHKFPHHNLITSDFNYLPNTIPGYHNGPVVQTVLRDQTVDITTYMCHQGFFDIMFATNFELMANIYKQIIGRDVEISLHRDFLVKWADTSATTTKNGENPMLDFYRNVSFMTTV